MLWVIFYEIYPRIKIKEMCKVNIRKTNTNIEIYVKNQKEKKPQRERFHYDTGDYNGVSLEC